MAKTPAAQMHLKLGELAKKLAGGYSDKEIMQDLKLKRRTFYYYKAKVCSMFGNIAEKKTEQVLEFEAHLLKNRLLSLLSSIEDRIKEKPKSLHDTTEAVGMAQDIAINIFKLEVEGFMARKIRRELKQSEHKAVR
jgi:hypothetical protein